MPNDEKKFEALMNVIEDSKAEDIILEDLSKTPLVSSAITAAKKIGDNLGESIKNIFVNNSNTKPTDTERVRARYNASSIVKKPDLPELEKDSRFFDNVSFRMEDVTTVEVRKSSKNKLSKTGLYLDPYDQSVGLSYEKESQRDFGIFKAGFEYAASDTVGKLTASYKKGHRELKGEVYMSSESNGVNLIYSDNLNSRTRISTRAAIFNHNDSAIGVNLQKNLRNANGQLFAGVYAAAKHRELGVRVRIVF